MDLQDHNNMQQTFRSLAIFKEHFGCNILKQSRILQPSQPQTHHTPSDLPSFKHLPWKYHIFLVLHTQIFHTIFDKFTHFRFSCSPYISLKLWQLQLRFTHFTYSNLAAMQHMTYCWILLNCLYSLPVNRMGELRFSSYKNCCVWSFTLQCTLIIHTCLIHVHLLPLLGLKGLK